MTWNIKYASETKSAADWKVSGLLLSKLTQGIDTLSMSAPRQNFDEDEKFAYGSIIELYRDDVRWFYGRVTTVPRMGTASAEVMRYEAAGPWWFLDNIVFEQSRTVVDTVISGVVTTKVITTSNIFVGQKLNTEYQGANEQIAEGIAWAASRGAPIQYANDCPNVFFPPDKVKDITVGELIRKVLRWVPDAVTWIDYATTPPTLHVKRVAALTAVELTPGTGYRIDNLNIVKRSDLVRPFVHLKYERATTVGSNSWTDVIDRMAPDPLPPVEERFGGIVETIDLLGLNVSVTSAPLSVTPVNLGDINWWKDRDETLRDANIETIEFSTDYLPRSNAAVPFANEIVSGSVADWMTSDNVPVVAQTETVSCKLKITHKNGSVAFEKPVSKNINTVNGPGGTYYFNDVTSYAEPIPEGLETVLYESVSRVQYHGSLSLVEQEVTRALDMGNTINITGSRAEWATMATPITAIVFDIDNGITTPTYGSQNHLGGNDLVELLRTNRNRNIQRNAALRLSGKSSAQSISLARHSSKSDTVQGDGIRQILNLSGTTDPIDKNIQIDAVNRKININGGATGITLALADMPGGKTAIMREFHWLDRTQDCKEYRAWILMTEPEEVTE